MRFHMRFLRQFFLLAVTRAGTVESPHASISIAPRMSLVNLVSA